MCEHKHLKCTNCVFICMDCGAQVAAPDVKAPEAEKPKRKTTRKGEKT